MNISRSEFSFNSAGIVRTRKIRCLWLLLLSCSTVNVAVSQLFDERPVSLSDYRSLGAGVAVQDFRPRPNNAQPESSRIAFDAPLFLSEYRQMGLRVAFGYSSYSFFGGTRSEIALSAESISDISVVKDREPGNFFLPVILSTSLVRAEGSTNSTKDFNVANIGLGTGLKFRRISENFGVQITGVGVLYYSTPGFSVESGSSIAVIAEVQFLFREVIGEGITAGYRFETQSWSMTDKKLNYSRMFQGPFLGIFF